MMVHARSTHVHKGGNLRFGTVRDADGNPILVGCVKNQTRHGAAARAGAIPEYIAWKEMRRRCSQPKHRDYHLYGARGITVCEQWEDFSVFIRDMGRRPSARHSLDRIDNSGPYSPENCRWVTMVEQNQNKRNTRWIEINGERKSLSAWCREYNVSHGTVHARLKRGMAPLAALTIPAMPRGLRRSSLPLPAASTAPDSDGGERG